MVEIKKIRARINEEPLSLETLNYLKSETEKLEKENHESDWYLMLFMLFILYPLFYYFLSGQVMPSEEIIKELSLSDFGQIIVKLIMIFFLSSMAIGIVLFLKTMFRNRWVFLDYDVNIEYGDTLLDVIKDIDECDTIDINKMSRNCNEIRSFVFRLNNTGRGIRRFELMMMKVYYNDICKEKGCEPLIA